MALDALTRFAAPTAPVRALLVGGYFGAWIDGDGAGLTLDDARLRRRAAAVGAGVVVVLDESACPVAETARLARYMAARVRRAMRALRPRPRRAGRRGRALRRGAHLPRRRARLARWIEMVRRRGACAHPDGVARMLASACEAFRGRARGPCPARAVRALHHALDAHALARAALRSAA